MHQKISKYAIHNRGQHGTIKDLQYSIYEKVCFQYSGFMATFSININDNSNTSFAEKNPAHVSSSPDIQLISVKRFVPSF